MWGLILFTVGLILGDTLLLSPILKMFGAHKFTRSILKGIRFLFRDSFTLPEEAAPKLSSATTEAPNSRLKPIIASNLRSR